MPIERRVIVVGTRDFHIAHFFNFIHYRRVIRDLEIARPNEHDLTAKNKLTVTRRNYAN